MNQKLNLALNIKMALGVIATLPFAPLAIADTGSNSEEIEKIQVTGSRIQRAEFSSSSPISVFGQEEIVNAGITSVDEFLKNIPAFTGFQLGSSTNNGGDGQKKVDLRGLGFNRTLVLINGRRQVGDVNGDGAVDLNAVPMSMIKQIEVLKDGASTIYGADAIAGVVNIILNDDFEGFKVSYGNGANVEQGDAQNKNISWLMGMATDRANFTMALEYQNQEEMLQGDRDWGTDALYPNLQPDGSFKAVASGSSNSRRIRGIEGLSGNWIVDEKTGDVRRFTGSDVYNYAPINALITPNERFQVGAIGSFDLVPNTVGAFIEGLYTKRQSQQRLAPDASFGVTRNYTSIATGENQWNDLVPAENPYNPFGVNPKNNEGISGADVRINRRFEESGGRLFAQDANTFRLVAGLNGEIGMDTAWELSYTYARNEVLDETKNYHRFDRWEIAVTPSLCNANPKCAEAGVLNPFSPFGGISQKQMDFLTAGSLKDKYEGDLKAWNFNLNGSFGELAAGPIGWAFGFERREEAGTFTPDEFSAEGLTTGGASDPQSGSFNVNEVYAEFLMPWADNFETNFSIRNSKYNTVGDALTYKLGLDYMPVDGVRIRSALSTGFRAPNISELNQDQSTGFPIIEPLCEFADRRNDLSAEAKANCETYFGRVLSDLDAEGKLAVDEDGNVINDARALLGADGEYGFAWQSAFTTSAPSTRLQPEESTTFTLGMVFDLPMMEGLVFSVDYWNIEIDNYIGAIPMNDLFEACLNSPGLSGDACASFGAVPADDGDLTKFAGKFNAAFPDAQGVPFSGMFPGDASASFGNIGRLNTDGLDLEAQYRMDVNWGDISGLDLRFAATHFLSREEEWPIIGLRDTVGTADGFAVYPEWRFNTTVGLNAENWNVRWVSTFIGEADDLRRPANITDDAVAESVLYHNLTGTYNFYDNFSILVGVNNVLDQDPPRFHSAFNANTEPGIYDVIGRRLFIQATASF